MTVRPELVLGVAERPETLTEIVLETIRNAIVNHDLPAGARVTEADLARQLNVSKTPVREALLRLREIGLIEPDERRGGRIVRPSRRAISDAYEVREALETYAAATAAERGDKRAVRAIVRLADRSLTAARAGDLVNFRLADDQLHRAIASCTGNERLTVSVEQSLFLVSVLRRRDVPGTAASVECAEDHVEVAKALCTRDVEVAARAMACHIRRVAELVLTAYDECHGAKAGNRPEVTMAAVR